jgi:hypothetical protein
MPDWYETPVCGDSLGEHENLGLSSFGADGRSVPAKDFLVELIGTVNVYDWDLGPCNLVYLVRLDESLTT